MAKQPNGSDTPDTASPCARRSFLKRVALATAGTSVASMLPVTHQPGAHEAGDPLPESCARLKIPMREVNGKVAFITGGSSGIGLGIARAFKAAGMKVVLGYRTKEHIDEAMRLFGDAKGRVHAISIDVTDRPDMEKAAAEVVRVFGKIHVLVNNAGVLYLQPLRSTTYEDWDWVMNVNVNGVFNGVQSFLPHILKHGEGGQIIATSSMDGLVAEPWHNPSYTTSKFAVVGMMEALRATLAGSGVGVSLYCPGAIKTRIEESSRNRPNSPQKTASSQSLEPPASSERDRMEPGIYMDPVKAGELVLRGMRSNELYILTHPEYEPIVRDRNDALIAAFPEDLHPTDVQVERLRAWRQNSIYSNERDRILCARSTRTRVAK